MGIDIAPMNPSAEFPQDENGRGNLWLSFNISGLMEFKDWLFDRSVRIDEFFWSNETDLVCEATCNQIADTIERHFQELSDADRIWLGKQVQFWRHCGGARIVR